MLFHIHVELGIDLKVCEFFWVNEHRQYCRLAGDECACIIPQLECVIRDKGKRSKYPDSFY